MDYKEKQLVIEEYKDLYASSIQTLKDKVNTIFPNAKINASVYSGIGEPTFSVSFYLIGEKADQSYQIVDNDPMLCKFIAHLPCEHPTKDTKFKLERLMGSLSLKPEEGSYFAMDSLKITHRKSTGNIDKQVDNLVKYFTKGAKTLIENKDNLYKKDINPKYLEVNF